MYHLRTQDRCTTTALAEVTVQNDDKEWLIFAGRFSKGKNEEVGAVSIKVEMGDEVGLI